MKGNWGIPGSCATEGTTGSFTTVYIPRRSVDTSHSKLVSKMESISRRKKIYENQRNLSPETKRKTAKHKRYQHSREDEMNDRRKYQREKRKRHEDRRRSKNYDLEIPNGGVLKKPRLTQDTRLTNESNEFHNRRTLQSKEAVSPEINESVKRNRGEHSKNYEIRPHKDYNNYGQKRRERSLAKHHSPKLTGKYNRASKGIRKSKSKEAVYKQLKDMIAIEWHHTKYVDRSTSGNSTSGKVRYIQWCPQYINPDARGHVRGGKTLPHHRCRECRQLCFHLLGQPGTRRLCLACSGYKAKYIPDWYYHKRCEYCR